MLDFTQINLYQDLNLNDKLFIFFCKITADEPFVLKRIFKTNHEDDNILI